MKTEVTIDKNTVPLVVAFEAHAAVNGERGPVIVTAKADDYDGANSGGGVLLDINGKIKLWVSLDRLLSAVDATRGRGARER